MFQIGVIVFREVLEISLIIGILALATSGVKGRYKHILFGLSLGILGSVLLALSMDQISESFDGSGQEIFNGTVLLLASLMIGWTVIWMTQHAKKVSEHLRQLGKKVIDGKEPIYALIPITALSVLREGIEIVLFSYGAFISGENISELILGGIIGLLLGIFAGFALYLGLLKVLGRYFFTVTSWILIFLAAGMASSSVGFFSSAGIISEVGILWDSSFLIRQESLIGQILHALFGYVEKPSITQALVYLAVIIVLFFGLRKATSK